MLISVPFAKYLQVSARDSVHEGTSRPDTNADPILSQGEPASDQATLILISTTTGDSPLQ